MSEERITLKSLNKKLEDLKADMESAGVRKRKQGNWFQRLSVWRKNTCWDEIIFAIVATTVVVSFLATRKIWPFIF